MNTQSKLIETLDRQRFIYSLWGTIGATVMMPVQLLDPVLDRTVTDTAWEYPIGLVAFAGFITTLVFAINGLRVEHKIKSDPALKAALNNEMFRHYNHKAMVWGTRTALIVSLIMATLARFAIPEMTVYTACMTVFFSTIWVWAVVRLVYMKIRG